MIFKSIIKIRLWFQILKNDHDGFANPSSITLVCKALKKFIPYDGFYPAQRTVQIAEQFYNSYKNNIYTTSAVGDYFDSSTSGNYPLQTIFTPLFAPGIMFNTIKSGIAVDYPVLTSSMVNEVLGNTGFKVINTTTSEVIHDMLNATSSFNRRIPFEAIINPSPSMANRTF